MIQINLLPWREQARNIKKIELALILGGAAIAALFVTLVMHFYFNGFANKQENRNNLIKAELSQEKDKLGLLEKKQHDYTTMETQLKYIVKLHTESFKAVHLLNELLTIVPATVTITKIIRDDPVIVITGKTKSNSQITLFMDNISASPFFNEPVLTEISKDKNSEKEEGLFKLRFEQKD